MAGTLAKIESGCGTLLMAIGESDNKPHTVIVENLGGGCESLQRTVVKLVAFDPSMVNRKLPLFILPVHVNPPVPDDTIELAAVNSKGIDKDEAVVELFNIAPEVPEIPVPAN